MANVHIANPLPYPEQTAVCVEIPTRSGGHVMCGLTVDHFDGVVSHVHPPPHFTDYAVAAGLDRYDTDFEVYLCVLAKIARGGR